MIIQDGYEEAFLHPTDKQREFQDDVLHRLADLEAKVRFYSMAMVALLFALLLTVLIK
jgi:hypothetical protein